VHTDNDTIETHAAQDARALVLFGSHARGDASEISDVDILQVCPNPRASYTVGKISYSNYTLQQLLRMARTGSLFVLHLLKESKPLVDSEHVLVRIRQAYCPASTATILSQVKQSLPLLPCDQQAFLERPVRLTTLAIHLLRTTAYAMSFAQGGDSFSMIDVAQRLNLPKLASIRRDTNVNWPSFCDVVEQLAELVGEIPKNPHGSLEAVIVNAWPESSMCVSLGLRLLAEKSPMPYDDLDLIWQDEWL